MHKGIAFLIGILLFFSASGSIIPAQQQRPGNERVDEIRHVLWGDVTLEGETDMKKSPKTINIILRTISGQIWGRDSVAPGGRYRFNSVPRGEYVLVVMVDDRVVMRENMLMMEQRPNDRRFDITLVLKGGEAGNAANPNLYARKDHNQDLFDKAQNYLSKDPKKAITYLEEIVKDDPDDFEAWTELGTAHFQRGKEKDAQKAYEKAIKAKPDYLLPMLNLSKIFISKKKADEAVLIATRAIETDPKSAAANYWLGEAYLLAKQGSKAVGFLNQALKLDSDGMAEAHLRLATLYDMAGYKDLAAKEYSQYLEKRPDYKDKKKMEKYISQNSQ